MKLSPYDAQLVYNTALKWFALSPFLGGFLSFLINAPFGRFSPKSQDSIWLVDGIKSWICMELVSPISFLFAFFSSPLSSSSSPPSSSWRQTLLAALFLIHYTNRALISPLRTPSRSKSHIIVPLFAVSFNLVNGALQGAWLASPAFLATQAAMGTTRFGVGVVVWAVGFLGNVVHDEVLLNIRRKAKVKSEEQDGKKGEHYAIPYGLLYKYISYPNYFCEWLEWAGYVIAAAPLPSLSFSSLSPPSLFSDTFTRPHTGVAAGIGLGGLTPPFAFLLSEVLLMLPRAVKGHTWYKEKFGDAYPKERRAVVPWLI